MSEQMRRRRIAAPALVAALSLVIAGTAPGAAQTVPEVPLTPGYPEFDAPTDPAPLEPVSYTADDMMGAIYEAEADGTDFWIDRMLAREGSDPAGNWLMTRGRALFMKTHNPSVIGFGGQVAYWESIDNRSAYTVTLGDGGYSAPASQRFQTPSYWRSTHTNTGVGFSAEVTKFITDNNVAVTNLAITNTAEQTQTLPIRVASPYTTTREGDELTGIVDAHNTLTLLFPRLSGDGFSVDGTDLVRTVTVEPGATVTTKVQMGFVTEEIADSLSEYQRYKSYTPEEAFAAHTQEYNRWWADNVPYIDVPDEGIKKFIYYRWWLSRFNYLDADIPGNDFQFPTSIEGVLGYNNAIALTVPMFIDDLKYLRDPTYSYGPWVSAGEGSRNDRYSDNPGNPTHWNDSYLQYTTEAAWRAYQVHGGQPEIMRNLAHYGEQDVKGQLAAYDTNGNYVIHYCCNYMNGNDADNPSFSFFNRGNERTETAYLYSNALATADAYDLVGEPEKAAEMRELAGNVQAGVLEHLWNPAQRLFLHRDTQTGVHIPWKEINNYYPFTVGLVPDEELYRNALRLFLDPQEYPIFPFYTANQRDKQQATLILRPGSNNFSQINSTVQFRLYSTVLREYSCVPPRWEPGVVGVALGATEGCTKYFHNEMYKRLLYWNAWAHFIDGDTRWPDANEFWANWNATTQNIDYRSWIHHTLLGSSIWPVIEDVMGLRPRSDDKVELWPIDIDWDHFTVNNLNYRGSDLTIVWDRPGDGVVHYPGVPEGYSVYIDGERLFTVDGLVRAIWDPETGAVDIPHDDGEVLFSTAHPSVRAPEEVRLSGRVVDVFQKAGVDLSEDVARQPNLALNATPSASYTDPAAETTAYPATDPVAAVSGFTINQPFWGSAGSGNDQDWYELDLDQPTTFDDVRLYFVNDRRTGGVPGVHRATTTTNRYREPALYSIQIHDGDGWVDVPGQSKTPTYPRSNYNRIQFPALTAQRVRVLLTHRQGYGTGLKEMQVFHTGVTPPAAPNQPPTALVRHDRTYQVPGQARLLGIPKDDGLPDGTLDTTWSVASGPGAALFDDRRSHTPIVTFSEPGEYVFAFEVSDGELVTETLLTVDVPDFPDQVNVALLATPSCSYTSPWESCEAINDGIDPPQSNDNQNPRWGTWPQTGTQWVELEWERPVRVDEADMYWFDDNGGVRVPSSWSIQYWADGEWVSVSNPSGYGTAVNQYNNVTFDPVITSRLRAVIQSGQGSVGVLEWKVYSVQPVAVRPLHVPTLEGEVPDLPPTVTQIFDDGRRLEAAVTWEEVADEQVSDAGVSFTIMGLVQGTRLIAEATIHVRATNDVAIVDLEDEHLVTLAGVHPDLPQTVTAVFDDGSKDNVSTTVTWDPVDPALYEQPGTFTVAGDVDGTTLRAQAHVTVISDTD